MLKCLDRTIRKLDMAQESCDNLVAGLECLLETNSVADQAVIADQEKEDPKVVDAQKKLQQAKVVAKKSELDAEKKKLQERVNEEDDVEDDEEGDKEDLAPPADSDLEDDEGEDDSDVDYDSDVDADVQKVRRSLNALQDEDLKTWVKEYFQNKLDGNVGEAKVIKRKIDQRIDIRQLDKEIVYHGETEQELNSDKEKEQGD
jgi:hypothetical protein